MHKNEPNKDSKKVFPRTRLGRTTLPRTVEHMHIHSHLRQGSRGLRDTRGHSLATPRDKV